MARRPGPSLDRQQVIDAAVALVDAEGAEALGVTRLAEVLGIRPPSLYHHVGKGDALARALVHEAARSQLHALTAAVAGVDAPEDALRALAHGARAWARRHPGLQAHLARTPPDNDHPDFRPVLDALLALFGRPLAAWGLEGEHAVHTARAVRAAVHGFVLLEQAGQFALAVDPEASFAWMVDGLVRGLRPAAG
ncbi:MAG: WHG domain-containing protein [Alphaproteobacteria bacterium]|nr:WHG domain-containing protein [Alphaproteobacteria bacterium]